ncbi:MAG: NAD(P)-binding domain-containing protein [Bacteroidales bacterium]|nr:NAD(P)-binding domain-containing protein [Bacteroidales bacterium]
MSLLTEEIVIYGVVILFSLAIVLIYILKQRRQNKIVERKIQKAKEAGLYEPASLHPEVNPNNCIKTEACIAACPEKDILGIRNGKATTINASRCVGHGACFHACPTDAITLVIGTEKRGVDIPHIKPNFESNVQGIFIAGELGGMGLIKNAVEQGRQAVENIAEKLREEQHYEADYDLVIVGAGPAGIAGALNAKKNGLNFLVLDQETLGGTVYTFPRSKIVMTAPMELPLYGKVKLNETKKSELLNIWNDALNKNNISIKENSQVEAINSVNGHFNIEIKDSERITSRKVLIAIGRRGTPRKLNVPGESKEKVSYRLLEPEDIHGKEILVVGGGDSAIESALMLSGQNNVTLSYRKDAFSRIKPKNDEKIKQAIEEEKIKVLFSTNVVSIEDDTVTIREGTEGETFRIKNDQVYIFIGGELPTQFLQKAGLEIDRKFGEAILSNSKDKDKEKRKK